MKLTSVQIEARDRFIDKFKTGEYMGIDNPCLCGKKDDVVTATTDRFNIPIRTVLCKNCSLMRSDPYYSPDTIRRFYSNDYRTIYGSNLRTKEDFFEEQNSFGSYIYEDLKRDIFKKDFSGKIVYEIGCGAGGILQYFRKRGNNVYGCDYDKDFIDYGISRGLENLVIGDVDQLSQFGQADIIIVHHVLEHFLDPITELSKIRKLLKDTGIFFVVVPGIYAMHDTYTELKIYLNNAHVYHFTLKTLTYLLNKSGFKLVSGSEEIRAIFKKQESYDAIITERYSDVLNYLLTTERYKYWYKVKKFSPKAAMMNTLLSILRTNSSLYMLSRDFYRKYFKK